MNRVRMGALALSLATLALGCTEKGRSLIPVEVTVENVDAVQRVRVLAFQGSTNPLVDTGPIDWPGGTLKLGLYISKDISGSVSVVGCALNAVGLMEAESKASPPSVDVEAGQSATKVALKLVPGPADVACRMGGSGGTGGGGGMAGTTGGGGYSGMGGGAGTTGNAGRGGSSGTTGAGGTAGTTGSAGTTGAGGTSGTTGRGGSTGGAGTTGAAGSSAGAGGRGGTGGSGGTGGGQVASWRGAVNPGSNPAITERLPVVAMDPLGNAVVAYEYGSDIYAVHFTAKTGTWSPPVAIDSRSADAVSPSIGVDKNGNYTVAWVQRSGSSYQGVWVSTSPDGEQWSAPTSLATTNAWFPLIAMNADGGAVVVWEENGNMPQVVAVTRPMTGGAWSAPTVMKAGNDNGERTPVVAVSGTGEAFVAWEQGAGTNNWSSIYLRQHTASGWGAEMVMETYDTQSCYTISLATNKSGAAIITWLQVAGSSSFTLQLHGRRYLPANGFGTDVKIAEASDIDWTQAPAVLLDDAGVATVALSMLVQGHFNVYVSRAAPSEAWPTPTAMETDNEAMDVSGDSQAGAPLPALGMDSAGNTTLIWRKRKGTRFDLWTRRLPAGGSWETPMLLETRDTYNLLWPVLAVGGNGNAIAAWYYATELDIWVNLFR